MSALLSWREVAPVLASMCALAACDGETTPRWDLAHDRIVAVRATPPSLAAGERGAVDVLVTSEAAGPAELAPMLVAVAPATPAPLVGAVAPDGGTWAVTAPAADALAAARTALGLEPGAPVPLGLVVTVAIGEQVFVATKTVWLGESAANPTIPELRIDGTAMAEGAPLVLALGERELAIDAGEEDDIAWFTSIGDLEDALDPVAHLLVEEPADGSLVVVRRDPQGGVAWRVAALSIR
jgi:hypothetical protein